MELFKKTAQFNFLCKKLSQSIEANELPDVNKPSTLGNVFYSSLMLFANKLSSFEPTAGISVDLGLLRSLGSNLSTASKSGNLAEIVRLLKIACDNLQDGGGGELYKESGRLLTQAQAFSSPKKPSWLDNYMAKQPNWLDRYMGEENAKQEADSDIAGMKSSLEAGPSVKVY